MFLSELNKCFSEEKLRYCVNLGVTEEGEDFDLNNDVHVLAIAACTDAVKRNVIKWAT